MLKRSIQSFIMQDLESKIVILSGPRQCGKTTFSKMLNDNFSYLNFDINSDKIKIINHEWDRKSDLIVFDELHKLDNWKLFLKGIYDGDGIPPRYIVTGSAKMDIYRKVGDSLAGRFFKYRLFPLDVHEICIETGEDPQYVLDRLLKFGNFPEPYMAQQESFYRRWKTSHLDVILRQDMLDLTVVHDIPKLELLIELLSQRVGSTISIANLARDLEKDAGTIKRWISILENLYVIFKIPPYSKNISRSLLKDSKYYFYDIKRVKNDAARLENVVAISLLKQLCFKQDTEGYDASLYFLRTRNGHEMDFLTCINEIPTQMIEVKTSKKNISPAFRYFAKFMPEDIQKYQLVYSLDKRFDTQDGIAVEPMAEFLRFA